MFEEGINNKEEDVFDIHEIKCPEDVLRLLSKRLDWASLEIIHVNDDYILSDSLLFFKSESFNPKNSLRVDFNNQPGIDAGGLRRQFFTKLFNRMANPNMSDRLFEGNQRSLVPICRPCTAISELFVEIGKIMAYALCHKCRPLRLTEATFRYLVTGDIQAAVPYLKVDDVATGIAKHFIEEVSHKKPNPGKVEM